MGALDPGPIRECHAAEGQLLEYTAAAAAPLKDLILSCVKPPSPVNVLGEEPVWLQGGRPPPVLQ